MASAFDFPADDLDRPDEPWFIEAKDYDPLPEHERQARFVTFMRKHSGANVYAVPNGGKMSDFMRIRRWREGQETGALDLEIKWHPRRCFIAEFKDGQGMPTRQQRDMLNRHYRDGFPCGVYRTAATLIEHLRAAGCPVNGEPLR